MPISDRVCATCAPREREIPVRTGAIACVSAPRAADTQRRRGRPVGRGLSSTEDFTNASLSGANRQLVLFLVVVLTRDDGCLTRMYERLIARHAQAPGHWLHGKTVGQMQSACSRFLGKAARTRPSWKMITDALRVQLPDDELPVVLAHAAGLYCRATGHNQPDSEYKGEITAPVWSEDTVVTTAMIHDLLAHGAGIATTADETEQSGTVQGQLDPTALAVLDELKQVRAELAETQARLTEVTAERDRYREIQTYLNRGARALDLEVQRLTRELDRRKANPRLGDLVAENTQLRERVHDLTGRLDHLVRRHATVLQNDFFPDISRTTLVALAQEQAEAGRPRRHGLSNLEVLPLAAGSTLDDTWDPSFGPPYDYESPPHPPRPRALRQPTRVT
jgi:hypothetical protein